MALCRWYHVRSGCTILRQSADCMGNNQKCGFFVTEEDFVKNRNRAIDINKAKGNCDKCKYSLEECKHITIDKNRTDIKGGEEVDLE